VAGGKQQEYVLIQCSTDKILGEIKASVHRQRKGEEEKTA